MKGIEVNKCFKPAGVFSPKLSRILTQKGAVYPLPAWIKKFEPTATPHPMTIRRKENILGWSKRKRRNDGKKEVTKKEKAIFQNTLPAEETVPSGTIRILHLYRPPPPLRTAPVMSRGFGKTMEAFPSLLAEKAGKDTTVWKNWLVIRRK
ncbi:hypothetical protein AVEN_239548-1 [Araneus ventricosus]|uniref:Uncharacterized protein n=1 Tax=Araneus ventricosus TaxID=182803 RepID=A0A4Y2HLN2_ARAVE|nr:hypothetical protein AVEN_239548-1 [Araneus ventricosus]